MKSIVSSKSIRCNFFLIAFLIAVNFNCLYAEPQQISDGWVAADGLGRAIPDYKQVGDVKTGKYVAMFYWIWHVSQNADPGFMNIEEVISKHPEAINDYNNIVWKKFKHVKANHWSEPLFGYYRSTDPWVLRKHAEMLADAGVDVVVFDCTNESHTWKESYDILFQTWQQARNDGVKTPKAAFMLPFGPYENSLISIEKLYQDIYKPGRYKDLWFYWQGKPLIMAYPDNVPEPLKSFFTFRPVQPGYRTGPLRKDQWSWLEVYPQHGYCEYAPGKFEMASVSVAQNATDSLVPAAMNDDREQVYGRSYTKKNGFNNSPDAALYGFNFQEQWDRAFELDPNLIFITGWNEWVAGRAKNWQGTENAFPDEFSVEYSRDIEPGKTSIGDNYYYQLISNIRKFKGVKRPQEFKNHTIKIDGNFDDWKLIEPEYLDHKGDTIHRKHRGYGDLFYINETGRNDFIKMKASYDKDYLYFYAECSENITPASDSNWMMILINADRDYSTGWQGYDYLINRNRNEENKASVEKNIGGKWDWETCGYVEYMLKGREMEIRIPRKIIPGKTSNNVNFEFKWVDNIKTDGNLMDFYLSGDVAPSGRFNYLYVMGKEQQWKEK
jgi:hypothetical protein